MSTLATNGTTAPTNAPAPSRSEELVFHGSTEPTIGVELEFQILDRDSGDLSPAAVRILKGCAEMGIPGVSAELMQSMLEVKTDVCHSVDEVRDQLLARVRGVRNIVSSQGCELAMGGTHPFHRTTNSSVFPAERYEKIMDRLVWLTYQRITFGLHVHIGVPSGDMAIGATNLLVEYLPHLVALSSSSPFWQGTDVGLASSRTALYRLLPHAGLPQYFSNWKAFRGYCKVMKDCQAIASFKDIYWDIRPRPDFGTIELRICDMPLTLAETLRLVAFIRTLTTSILWLLAERPKVRRGDIRRHWIAVENKWLATRYGLQAAYIRGPSGRRTSLALDLAEVVERLMPLARETGDDRYLAGLRHIDKLETGAERQRRRYRESGNWKTVMDETVAQLKVELDGLTATKPAAPKPAATK